MTPKMYKKDQRSSTYVSLLDIVGVFVAILSQTKVADLDNILLSQQHVSRSQIAMDQL